MIKNEIDKITANQNLYFDEAYNSMLKIMSGEVNNSQIAALLIGLKTKGETADEVAGFVKAMREKSIKIKLSSDAVDVCGTGGDNSGTFNISTAVSFAVAGAGIKVAKHGNRSISSKSGSADVLRELGININLTPEQSTQAIEEIGISFLFAPNYHPAMKYVMPVRKELATKTVFNILGPLTNPASTKRQLIGTFNDSTAKLMSQACQKLEMEEVKFVCCENRYDEFLPIGKTKLFSSNNGTPEIISNKIFDYPEIPLNSIQGDSAGYNAEIILNLFSSNKKSEAFFVVAANTAIALQAAGYSNNLDKCKKAAEESILSGAALEKLSLLKEFGV